MKRLLLAVAVSQLSFGPARAQSDFGLWYELGAEKKLSRQWNIGGEAELRTRNNAKTIDRWSVGLSAEYRIIKGVKASAGYTFLYDNNPEELTFNSSGDPNKYTPRYWGARHRFNVSLSGSTEWNRFKFSLRERWQYTYRPEVADKKYKFSYDEDDNLSAYTMQPVKGKGKHVLRSRIGINYDIPQWKLDPFVNIEMFNDKDGIQKMRYQAGIDYKFRKKHTFALTYRFQDVNNDDDDHEVNSHLVGISYTYKF